jgi:hypothetical protein
MRSLILTLPCIEKKGGGQAKMHEFFTIAHEHQIQFVIDVPHLENS